MYISWKDKKVQDVPNPLKDSIARCGWRWKIKLTKRICFRQGISLSLAAQVLPADAVSLTMNIEEVRKVLGVSSF